MSYNAYGHVVDSCPHNETEFAAAATRLNCNVDKFGYNQYTCVPKFDLTSLVEFCYNLTVGYYPKDHCLRLVSDGGLQSYSCRQFTEGCPTDHYRGSDLYQFPACSQINTERRCFYADLSCPKETASYTTEGGAIPTDSTTLMDTLNATANVSSTFTTPVEQGSADVGMIIGIVVAALIAIVLIALAVVLWRRKGYSCVPEEDQELPKMASIEEGGRMPPESVTLISRRIRKGEDPPSPAQTELQGLPDGEEIQELMPSNIVQPQKTGIRAPLSMSQNWGFTQLPVQSVEFSLRHNINQAIKQKIVEGQYI